jgi:hypothetical protein
VKQEQAKGTHLVTFDASDQPSGIYFYALENRNLRIVRKALVIK